MHLIVSVWGALCLLFAGFAIGMGIYDTAPDAAPPIVIAFVVALNIWSVCYSQTVHPSKGVYRKDAGSYFWKFYPNPKSDE